MRKITLLFLALSGVLFFQTLSARSPQNSLRIIPNLGQLVNTDGNPASEVKYLAEAPGMQIFFRESGFSYVFSRAEFGEAKENGLQDIISTQVHRIDLEFLGAQIPTFEAQFPSGAFNNYYLAHCKNGITRVPEFGQLTYKNLYPGIDLVFYANETGVKYDYLVHPGADPGLIRFTYKGTQGEGFLPDGSIRVQHEFGTLQESAPVSFQGAQTIDSKFIMEKGGDGENALYRILLGEYDKTQMLTIDPSLLWATYFGGNAIEQNSMFGDIKTDSKKNVWYTGHSASNNFPATTGTFAGGTNDAVIVKFGPTGNRLFATYIGSTANDLGSGIDIDNTDHVYMVGQANDNSFPTTSGAYQNTVAGLSDGIICKFDTAGLLIWATLFGGNSIDEAYRILWDPQTTDLVITGETQSAVFPTTAGAFQTANGGNKDVFLAKFSNSGSRIWATLLGGAGNDSGFGLTLDANSNIYVGGPTGGNNFPVTSGAFQTTYGGGSTDMFLAKFTSGGSQVWTTYFGGNQPDFLNGLATAPNGDIYFTGRTTSANFPVTAGAYQTTYASSLYMSAVGKFNANGNRIWASYFGGTTWEEAFDCQTHANGGVVITGQCRSANFPVTNNAIQGTHGGGIADIFISKFSSTGALEYSTFYGGSNTDYGKGVGTDISGNIYAVGYTQSTNFPTTVGAFQTTFGGGTTDAVVIAIQDCGLLQSSLAAFDTITICNGSNTTLDAGPGFTSYLWSTSSTNQSITVSSPGKYFVSVTDGQGCTGTDTVRIMTVTPPTAAITPAGPTTFCAGNDVMLAGSGSSMGYQWYLNGGAISGANSNTWLASQSGTYTLVESNGGSCQDSTTTGVTVTVNALPNVFAGNDTSICAGSCMQYNATNIAGASYLWSPATTCNSGSIANPLCCLTSTTTSIVTVTDANSCLASDTITVTVKPVPTPNFGGDIDTCEGATLTLNAGAGASWVWCNGATTQTIQVTTTGLYCVTVTGANGCTGSDTSLIQFFPNPISSFTWSTTGQNAAAFTEASTNATAWSWDFGDGNTSSQQNPTHTYANAGPFTVCLTAWSGNCMHEFCDTVSFPSGILPGLSGGTFEVFPVPAVKELNFRFELKTAEVLEVQLVNMLGQSLKSVSTDGRPQGLLKLDVGDLPAGPYLLLAKGQGGQFVRQVVIGE
ncbi:MAG: SBBP repeat-containing protein [Bacteroidia bacterium]|nr:SBBP repeat-containing protein [Bacteroidia bacterium]